MRINLLQTEIKFCHLFPKASHVKACDKRNKKPVWFMGQVIWKALAEVA